MAWTNSDGLQVRFDREQGDRAGRFGVTTGAGKERELVALVNLRGAARVIMSGDNVTSTSFSGLDTPLPAGVKIEDVDIITTEATAGGTGIVVGTYLENGTVVDADGIATAIAGTAGAQVGTVTTAPWYIGITTTGVYTAGKVKIIIRYLTV
jgi:hypothetical protein